MAGHSEATNNPRSCWEFWGCKDHIRRKCDAYLLDGGMECWMLKGNFSKQGSPRYVNGFRTCKECEWYDKIHSE